MIEQDRDYLMRILRQVVEMVLNLLKHA